MLVWVGFCRFGLVCPRVMCDNPGVVSRACSRRVIVVTEVKQSQLLVQVLDLGLEFDKIHKKKIILFVVHPSHARQDYH